MISRVLPTINVLYENIAWIPPLREALEREGFRVRLVHVNEGIVDPSAPPPEGIWMNRISPSSHTRGHVHTVELARQLLFWLESHGRRVINGLSAFELEMSKLRQDLVLRRHGIRTPRTVLAVGRSICAKRRHPSTARSSRSTTRGARAWASGSSATLRNSRSILTTGASTPGPAPG